MSRRPPRAAPARFPLSATKLPLPASAKQALRSSVRSKSLVLLVLLAALALFVYAFHGVPSEHLQMVGSLLREDTHRPPPGGVDDTPGIGVVRSGDEDGEGPDKEGTVDAGKTDPPKSPQSLNRSFEEPDFALLSGLQPHQIGCDVPLDGENAGPLVFLGIFSSAPARKRRDLYRRVVLPDFPPDKFTVKFILGQQKPIEGVKMAERMAMAKAALDVHEEIAKHNDIVMLDIIDNIDHGKTHAYFKWVAHEFAGEGQVKGRPRFVMKADDDTFLVMPNVVANFADLDCSKNYYWGTSAGRSGHFKDYFRGLAYALSWPLASWIGNADMPLAHVTKIEDARTGQWLRMLDKATDPVTFLDVGWNMGDWNQLNVSVDTVALHWLKWDEWVEEQAKRIHDVWAAAGRAFEASNGVPRSVSIASGRKKPQEAQAELERQKELGWDVAGNVMDV